MKKEYTINELASILGCSRTAVVKKIKPDENNPGIKRYKGRYEIGSSNGQMTIILDDIDLDHEKRLSRGVNNVTNKTGYIKDDNDIIDVEPENETKQNDTLIEFTNRYIEQFTTFQKEMYNELKQRDNQILLLTTTEKTKENEYLIAKAENTTLKKRNTILTVLLSVAVTVLICFITFFITSVKLTQNDSEGDIKKEHVKQEIPAQHVRK